MKEHLLELIDKLESVGFFITFISSDMGQENMQLWALLGITPSQNFFVHNNRVIYVFADIQHAFKNITQAFLKHGCIKIPKEFKEKYDLPSDTAKMSDIKEVFAIDENNLFKLTPKIQSFMFHPNNYQKMRVKNSYELIHPDVASTLRLVAENRKDKKNYLTTAWVVEKIAYWQRITTSRHQGLALSKFNETKYHEAKTFLTEMIRFFDGIRFETKARPKKIQNGKGSTSKISKQVSRIKKNKKTKPTKSTRTKHKSPQKRKLKKRPPIPKKVCRKVQEIGFRRIPSQRGAMISTKSYMDLSEFLLEKQGFKFVLGSRCTTEAVENSFSITRLSNSKPDSIQFQNITR